MVAAVSLNKSFVSGLSEFAARKLYADEDLSLEKRKTNPIYKDVVISLTKTFGRFASSFGLIISAMSTGLNMLRMNQVTDDTFLGAVKRWSLPVSSLIFSAFSLFFSYRGEAQVNRVENEKKKNHNDIVNKIVSLIQGKTSSLQNIIQKAFDEHDGEIPGSLESKANRSLLQLNKWGLRYDSQRGTLQSISEGVFSSCINETIEGEEKVLGIRVYLPKAKTMFDVLNDTCKIKLISKNKGEGDSDFVEGHYETDSNLSQLTGIEVELKEEVEPSSRREEREGPGGARKVPRKYDADSPSTVSFMKAYRERQATKK